MAPVCPKCDVRLLIVHLQEIAVDFCDRCRGLWLDTSELDELLTRAGARPDEAFRHALGVTTAPTGLTRHLCPRCDQPMHELQHGELTLEQCPQGHGLWFDAGELQRLLATGSPAAAASRTVADLNQIFVQPN